MQNNEKNALIELCLRLGDDRLILGQRLSEWCGHAPILEEDIALTNISLDLIGQANNLLNLAGKLDGKGKDSDTLAFLRDSHEFKNLQLVEQANVDFGRTIARQFLFDAWSVPLMEQLQKSSETELAGIAAKASKEEQYHLRHSSEWILRLGDGTEESKARIQSAFDDLWRFTNEMFDIDPTITTLTQAKIIPDLKSIKANWENTVTTILKEATLTMPAQSKFPIKGSRDGKHSEALGHILTEMQFLQRAYPGATW